MREPLRRMLAAIRHSPSAISDMLLAVAFFILYFTTLAPSVLAADNGEFQLVAWKLGIAHPPGYPLYTLIGFLFTRFFQLPAFAMNLLSAIIASITLVIVSKTVRLLTRSILAGLLAASILGVSTTFWSQATTANIRMPTAFFAALCVYILVRWQSAISVQPSANLAASPSHRLSFSSSLTLFAITFSLALSHHLSIIFPGVFFIIYILLIDPTLIKQPRRWIKPTIVFLIALLILGYLPLRGATGGTLSDGEATTYLVQPDKFLDHVLARGFEGDFFYFLNTRSDLLLDRVALIPTLFNFQFNWLVAILALIGSIRLLLRDRKLALMLLGGIVLHTFITITYRAPQTVEYMLPAYVLLAIVVGYGLGEYRSQESEVRRKILASSFRLLKPIALLSALLLLLNHFPSFNWLHQHDDTRDYAASLLNAAPPNAILLSNWHWANPMWYLQQVEGLRSDVTVQYVYPRGEPLATSWLNAIKDGLNQNRSVVVDMVFRSEFDSSGYFFYPIASEALEVRNSPLIEMPLALQSSDSDFENRFRLIGYSVPNGSTQPSEPAIVELAYRVEAPPDRDYSFFVHLIDSSGNVIGQMDQTIATTRYHVGDVIVARFFVAPLTTVQTGEYQLMAGIYSVGSDRKITALKSAGNEQVSVTNLKVDSPDRLIEPAGIDLSGGIVFVNSTSSTSGELHPGDRLTLDLHFIATRPLQRDIVVSVQMTGSNWRANDDSVPALGAIPTLKWIAGSEIDDPHVLIVPQNASGQATVTLSLYDNFTQQPLALLNADLIKQGPTIPVGTWNIK
jgi:4-amino-4-deoxy-L-arabinose transferase-like glycosyltransferase